MLALWGPAGGAEGVFQRRLVQSGHVLVGDDEATTRAEPGLGHQAWHLSQVLKVDGIPPSVRQRDGDRGGEVNR